jgi:MYXO-CTERM domain-containing protein
VANKGGCSCTTASDPVGGPRSSLSAFGLLALASVLRSRKRGLAPCL